MRFGELTVVATALLGCVFAYPGLSEADIEARAITKGTKKRPWIGVQPDGVRAPCPGSNTLANLGFINRNGKNITRQQYQQGFLDAFGLSFETTNGGATNTMILCALLRNQTAPCDTFDLDQLDFPHAIEHDASMSRNDRRELTNPDADNHTFNETVWDRTLTILDGVDHINMTWSNTLRLRRVEQAQAEDFPGWFQFNNKTSITEHVFILAAMNDPTVGTWPDAPQARVDWVNYWFEQEDLPTSLGWVKPHPPRSQFSYVFTRIENQPTVPASTAAKRAAITPAAAVEERGNAKHTVPLSRVPQLIQHSKGSSAVHKALHQATAAAGPKPTFPNFYDNIGESVPRLKKMVTEIVTYKKKVEGIFEHKLYDALHEKKN